MAMVMMASKDAAKPTRQGSTDSGATGRETRSVRFEDVGMASSGTTTDSGSQSTSVMTSPLSADFRDSATTEKDIPKLSQLQGDSSKTSHVEHDTVDDEETSPSTLLNQDPSSAKAVPQSHKCAEYSKVGEYGICKMHKFSLYETSSRYFIVGADVMDRRFRILKIDRTVEPGALSIAEDDIVYTKHEMSQLLNAIDDGNKATGGMRLRCSTWGLLGFIKFTGAYYMLLITKRSQVAMIGGHFVYQVDGTELIPLTPGSGSRYKADPKNPEETRLLQILSNIDLTRSFYFSYSYNITRTLQRNITTERDAVAKGLPYPRSQDHNPMFVWNDYLLKPAAAILKNTYDWCIPIMHGYVDQAGKSEAAALIVADDGSSSYLWPYSLHHHHCSSFTVLCWSSVLETWCK